MGSAEGTERRVALGRAIHARAQEVADTVVASMPRDQMASGTTAEVVAQLIARPCKLGTQLIGNYFATGDGATRDDTQELASSAKPSVADNFALSGIAKCYLIWRDVTIAVVRAESARLDVDSSVLREAVHTVRLSCDASLVHMVKEFDVQRYDLQDRLEAERAKLTHLALHDPLTGLANRALLLDRLSHAVASPARRQRQVGVLFLDLDGFKSVNDRFGHRAGDTLLMAVADRLSALVRPSDTVARLGGDEFVILCEDLSGGEPELVELAERIQMGVANSARSIDQDLSVSVSIGAALAHTGSVPEQVLAQADAAMYAAKHREVRSVIRGNAGAVTG